MTDFHLTSLSVQYLINIFSVTLGLGNFDTESEIWVWKSSALFQVVECKSAKARDSLGVWAAARFE